MNATTGSLFIEFKGISTKAFTQSVLGCRESMVQLTAELPSAAGIAFPLKTKLSIKLFLTIFLLTTVLALGVILGWFHHQKTSAIFLTSSQQLFEQVAEDVSNSFHAEYGSVSSTVRLLAMSPLTQDQNRAARLSRLPVLVSVLESQPEIVALSVGYSDAEYFIVRSLNSSYMIKRFGAPENARYAVDNIERTSGHTDFTRLYYDQQLNLLEEKQMGYTSYNPTVRPWYRLAVYNSDVTTTSPYLFYFIGKVGVTVVADEPDSGNVFAADITLESLSNTLIRNRVSPSSQMLLYTSDDEVIASMDPDSIVVESGDDSLTIIELQQLDIPVVRDYFQQPNHTNNSHFFLDSGGSRWIGINKPLSLVGFTANLLIIAPEAELLQEAYAIRNQSMIITIVIILLGIPLTFFAAKKLSQPLASLVSSAKPLVNFDFSQPISSNSNLGDIQQIEASLESTRKSTLGMSGIVSLLNRANTGPNDLQTLAEHLLSLSAAEAVLLYTWHPHRLVPVCFFTRSGGKAHQKLPTLAGDDTSNKLISAFMDNNSSTHLLHYHQANAEKTGVHAAMLNQGQGQGQGQAQQIRLITVTLSNPEGEKTGLLGLFFCHSALDEESLNQHQSTFLNSLGICCGRVMALQNPPADNDPSPTQAPDTPDTPNSDTIDSSIPDTADASNPDTIDTPNKAV